MHNFLNLRADLSLQPGMRYRRPGILYLRNKVPVNERLNLQFGSFWSSVWSSITCGSVNRARKRLASDTPLQGNTRVGRPLQFICCCTCSTGNRHPFTSAFLTERSDSYEDINLASKNLKVEKTSHFEYL